jgi:hypothetical protein
MDYEYKKNLKRVDLGWSIEKLKVAQQVSPLSTLAALMICKHYNSTLNLLNSHRIELRITSNLSGYEKNCSA